MKGTIKPGFIVLAENTRDFSHGRFNTKEQYEEITRKLIRRCFMDIVKKMEGLRQNYEHNQRVISELMEQQKRLEGAYAILLEIGIEQGVVDSNGNPINPEVFEEETILDEKDEASNN